MAWWDGPLCGMDFETTCADPETARVVTACVAYRAPGIAPEPQDTWTWLVNPGEAAAIHGVTNERAQADGQDAREAVDEIRYAFRHAVSVAPVVIFNCVFDLTILDRECRRHDLPPPVLSGALIVDPLVIDKHTHRYRKGSRRLDAQCEYHRVPIERAHDAEGDTLAAMRLAWRLGQKFPRIGGLDGRALTHLQRTAYRGQQQHLAEYFASQGKPETVNTEWPLIPWFGPDGAGAERTEAAGV